MSRSATRRGRDSGWPEWFALPQNLQTYAPALLEGFENDADWTAGTGDSVADDAVNTFEGAQGVKLTLTGAGNATMDKVIAWTAGAGEMFSVGLYLTGSITQFIIYLSSVSNFAKVMQYTGPNLAAGWHHLLIPKSSFVAAGGELWTNQMIRIRCRFDAGGAVDGTFDGLYAGGQHQGAVVLRFDDGRASVYTEAFAYMNPRGIRGNAAIYTNGVGQAGNITAAQLQEMYAAGWDILNHTSTDISSPYLPNYSQAEQETYISDGATALAGWGVGDSRLHLVFPGGAYNADTLLAMTATGMLTGQTVTAANTNLARIATLTAAGLDGGWTSLNTLPIAALTSLATIKTAVDNAVRYGYVLILTFHNLVAVGASGSDWTYANFEGLIDYLVARQIPTLRTTDLWALKDGPLTVPGYRR